MKNSIITLCIILISLSISAQNEKRSLTFDDILKWERITEKLISDDGEFIIYKEQPWKGDPTLRISSYKGKEITSISCASHAKITCDSKNLVYVINSPVDTIRSLKLKKTKKEDMPQKRLGIYSFETNTSIEVPFLISHKVPKKWSGWIAYQAQEKPKKDDKSFPLFIKNLKSHNIDTIPNVKSYVFANEYEAITFVSEGDSLFEAGVYYYDLTEGKKDLILSANGDIKHLTISKKGNKLAFVADTSDSKKNYALYSWNGEGKAKIVVDNNHSFLPDNWEISQHESPVFSENNEKLFFTIKPMNKEIDTTILKEEIPVVDVWHWNEEVLHSQQIHTKKQDSKRSFFCVYHTTDQKAVQLETPEFTGTRLINKGNSNYIFAISNRPYALQSMWEGGPEHNDFYIVDMNTGKARMIKQDCRANPNVSPNGKYIYWYNAMDTTWNTWDIENSKEYVVSGNNQIQAANELNDMPGLAYAYGIAGWTENDDAMIVYDRYDIWSIDPTGKTDPINISNNGREQKTSYRIVRFNNKSGKTIKKDEVYLIKSFNEVSKANAYYSFNIYHKQLPELLYKDEYLLGTPIKAKNADRLVFTKENFETYPDLWSCNLDIKKQKKISDVAPQQDEFLWGTAELISWTSLDGKEVQGTLHKPEDFDPNKKYPMIVNFYEKNSNRLLSYRMPENHRSTVDYHYYTSNGYIVFNPDVHYEDGYPGESAYNCVMPGITTVVNMGFVDETKIAAQGHSWGGYQVAYLATRTDMFAAIESGAPVVNMYSAYGGIRLWTGRNRSFQYEHGQSRIGLTPWESPMRYIENSPIFNLDKIKTPILIMHNENDGAVPWSQGVEFFIGMRRLNKPCWMLNYNEGDHWPTQVRDKYDFQVRLAQFFDHYLKGKPMPEWMEKGVPAIEKGLNLGY